MRAVSRAFTWQLSLSRRLTDMRSSLSGQWYNRSTHSNKLRVGLYKGNSRAVYVQIAACAYSYASVRRLCPSL